MEEIINDNANNINNIDKYDRENNSMNSGSISNFDRSRFFEEIGCSYYLLIGSYVSENITDLIGKCPAEPCSGKAKDYNNFQSEQGLSYKLNSYVQTVW